MKDARELKYRPFEKGVYQVQAGLKPLLITQSATDPHQRVFQTDSQWSQYRESKLQALKSNQDRYIGFSDVNKAAFWAICNFVASELVNEYPDHYSIQKNGVAGKLLKSSRSQGCISLDSSANERDLWIQLSLELQEDLAIWQIDGEREWLSAISILSPNHWAPEEKLGQPFFKVHEPVAGIESINRNAKQMVETMVFKGPFQRFAWGLATDQRLNHHPLAPDGQNPQDWRGRRFDPKAPQLYVRTERQCLIPFPELKASLFTIRTYFEDVNDIKKDPTARQALKSALESMTPESRIYKGLSDSYHDILEWLMT